MKITVTMKLERLTKNQMLYKSNDPRIQNIYISKTAFAGEEPQEIVITAEPR